MKDPITTIIGPSLARQRNAILMAFRWRADDGPTLNAGVTVYLAPLDSLPPGGQAVMGYLAPHPGYLHPRGASCPGRFILLPANTSKNICMLFCYFSVSF